MTRRIPAAWACTAIAFLALDAVWLSTMASRLYRPALGALMRPDFDWLAAGLFYAVYITGIVVFAVWPSKRFREALWRGGFLGFVAYATYDLTNQATLPAWPWLITVADLCWGTFATAVAAALAWRFTSRPSPR